LNGLAGHIFSMVKFPLREKKARLANPHALIFAAVLSAAVPFATAAQAEEKEPIAIFEIDRARSWDHS
jgi:hypothetical protein